MAILASCSGAVSAPPVPVTPGPLLITPAQSALFSELPTTFTLSGGTAPYFVTSSDQATVPVIGTVTGTSFIVVPNPVAADTSVTLTVQDSGTATPVTAALTVRPRTISSVVTITPSASQPAACGTAVCAGGDAEVATTLVLNGVPLAGRSVRFDVVSGDVRVITSAPGTPESLGLSTTTTTDSAGSARIRIRALQDAGSQTALLQITDISSGFTQRASVTIAPSSAAPLNAQPDTITFRSVVAGRCADEPLRADVIVFGGRPPYQISQPGTFDVSPSVVARSGERFTVAAIGQCTPGSLIAVVDSAGNTVSVNVISESPAVISAPTPPAFVASPEAVTLDSCDSRATIVLAGGNGASTYFGHSGHSAVTVSVDRLASIGTIQRTPGSPATTVTPVIVSFSDGSTTDEVTVNLTVAALAACP